MGANVSYNANAITRCPIGNRKLHFYIPLSENALAHSNYEVFSAGTWNLGQTYTSFLCFHSVDVDLLRRHLPGFTVLDICPNQTHNIDTKMYRFAVSTNGKMQNVWM